LYSPLGETVYVPLKILVRLNDYVKAKDIGHLGKANASEAIRWIETRYGYEKNRRSERGLLTCSGCPEVFALWE
jgi:hypothetical protein